MKRLDFERVQSLILNSISILILFLFCLNKKETKNSRTTGSLRAFVRAIPPLHLNVPINIKAFNYLEP